VIGGRFLRFQTHESFPEFGGSELQNIIARNYSGKAPAIDLQVEANRQNLLATAIKEGLVVSAHDLSEGGLAVALAESLFKGQGLGVEVNLTGDATVALFSESQSRFLVTVKAENKEQFENLWTEASQIGSVTNDGKLKVSVNGEPVIEDTVDELHKLWSEAIPKFVAAK
jgi:phosphoribosylformylglycinamidine synthase subunit PurL